MEVDTSNALRDSNVYCCYYSVVYYSEVLNKLYLQSLGFFQDYFTLLK